jgi:hypothetical protein
MSCKLFLSSFKWVHFIAIVTLLTEENCFVFFVFIFPFKWVQFIALVASKIIESCKVFLLGLKYDN